MDDKTVTRLFDDMKGDVTSFVKSNIELAKLETFEKLSKASANTTTTLVLIKLSTIILILIFATLGFYLADVLGSNWQGFALASAGAILLLVIFLLLRKTVKKSITNSIISFLMRKDDEVLTYKSKE